MARALRNNRHIGRADWLWDPIRPFYDRVVHLFGRNGLERNINGSDLILVLPSLRNLTESYEPEVWGKMMAKVRPGDVIADVGAFVGLYTIAFANRVGSRGTVVAFEPDPANWALLQAQATLNCVSNRVQLVRAAVGSRDGSVPFSVFRSCESHIVGSGEQPQRLVDCVCLDSIFQKGKIDILKIDVEGHEEEVLKGATLVLQDRERAPRTIFVEAHPYAWAGVGTSSSSLLSLLAEHGYVSRDLSGQAVKEIKVWGHLIADKQ